MCHWESNQNLVWSFTLRKLQTRTGKIRHCWWWWCDRDDQECGVQQCNHDKGTFWSILYSSSEASSAWWRRRWQTVSHLSISSVLHSSQWLTDCRQSPWCHARTHAHRQTDRHSNSDTWFHYPTIQLEYNNIIINQFYFNLILSLNCRNKYTFLTCMVVIWYLLSYYVGWLTCWCLRLCLIRCAAAEIQETL